MTTRKLGFSVLLAAVYARLTTHPLTNTMKFRNYVKRTDTMPYHMIGRFVGKESDRFSTRDSEVEDNVFQVDSWYDKKSGLGDKACADAQTLIVQALTSSALTITGYHNSITFDLDYANILTDDTEPEDPVWHGILRFRVEMAPNP